MSIFVIHNWKDIHGIQTQILIRDFNSGDQLSNIKWNTISGIIKIEVALYLLLDLNNVKL